MGTRSFLVAVTSGAARGEGRKLPPYGWTSKNVCAFIVMELLRITRQIHCKAVEPKSHVDTQTIQPGMGDFVL